MSKRLLDFITALLLWTSIANAASANTTSVSRSRNIELQLTVDGNLEKDILRISAQRTFKVDHENPNNNLQVIGRHSQGIVMAAIEPYYGGSENLYAVKVNFLDLESGMIENSACVQIPFPSSTAETSEPTNLTVNSNALFKDKESTEVQNSHHALRMKMRLKRIRE